MAWDIWVKIGLGNGLSPVMLQAIKSYNADFLLI